MTFPIVGPLVSVSIPISASIIQYTHSGVVSCRQSLATALTFSHFPSLEQISVRNTGFKSVPLFGGCRDGEADGEAPILEVNVLVCTDWLVRGAGVPLSLREHLLCTLVIEADVLDDESCEDGEFDGSRGTLRVKAGAPVEVASVRMDGGIAVSVRVPIRVIGLGVDIAALDPPDTLGVAEGCAAGESSGSLDRVK